MEQREEAFALGDNYKANNLNKQIKTAVTNNKRQRQLDQRKDMDDKGYKREGIKRLKSNVTT